MTYEYKVLTLKMPFHFNNTSFGKISLVSVQHFLIIKMYGQGQITNTDKCMRLKLSNIFKEGRYTEKIITHR